MLLSIRSFPFAHQELGCGSNTSRRVKQVAQLPLGNPRPEKKYNLSGNFQVSPEILSQWNVHRKHPGELLMIQTTSAAATILWATSRWQIFSLCLCSHLLTVETSSLISFVLMGTTALVCPSAGVVPFLTVTLCVHVYTIPSPPRPQYLMTNLVHSWQFPAGKFLADMVTRPGEGGCCEFSRNIFQLYTTIK